MIELGVATVHFRYPRVSDDELNRLASRMFDVAELAAQEFIRVHDVETILELEEGTLKARSRYRAPAIALGAFLAAYGSIREGADYVARDVLAAGKFVVTHLPKKAGASEESVISSRRSATLQRRIEGVFREAAVGKISPEEGTARVMRLLESENDSALPPELVDDFQDNLYRIHKTRQLRSEQESALSVEQAYLSPLGPQLPKEIPSKLPFRREYPDPFRSRKIVVLREGPKKRKVLKRE
jgi:hypothetical protein